MIGLCGANSIITSQYPILAFEVDSQSVQHSQSTGERQFNGEVRTLDLSVANSLVNWTDPGLKSRLQRSAYIASLSSITPFLKCKILL